MDECSSLHHTLRTLLPPRSLNDFTSHRVLAVSCLHLMMPPAMALLMPPPSLSLYLPLSHGLSGSWTISTTNYSYIMSYSLNVFMYHMIRCEVKGEGCRMCTDCKALCGKFVMLGSTKWTELNVLVSSADYYLFFKIVILMFKACCWWMSEGTSLCPVFEFILANPFITNVIIRSNL